MSLRALQRCVKRMEDAGKPKQSPISIWFGALDAWVENDILPGIESGVNRDMVDVVAALRAWETGGIRERAYAR